MTSRRARRRELEHCQAAAPGSAVRSPARRDAPGAPGASYLAAHRWDGAGRPPGYGGTLYEQAVQVKVSPRLSKGVRVGAEAPGACFAVALRFILTHPDAPGARLVHGVVSEEGLWWPHAWCEADDEDGGDDGVVLDPSSMRFYSRRSFYDVLAATPITTYEPTQAKARALLALRDDAEHWGETGPWAEYDTAVRKLVDRRLNQLLARSPDLARWFRRMLETDPVFAEEVRLATGPTPLAMLHIVEHLAGHPERWRTHTPGQGWQGPVHPHGRPMRLQ